MALPDPYRTYRDQAVLTAGPPELTLMLYQGALRFVRQARAAVDQGRPAAAHEALVRAQDVFEYLIATLDQENPVAPNLERLYRYFLERLALANARKEPALMDEVSRVLEELVAGWAGALERVRNGQNTQG